MLYTILYRYYVSSVVNGTMENFVFDDETQHSLWNHGPQFENLMFTVVSILSHNYEDEIIKTFKTI